MTQPKNYTMPKNTAPAAKNGAKKSTGSPAAVRSAARKPRPPGSTRRKHRPEAGSPLPHFKCFHKTRQNASPKITEQKQNTPGAAKVESTTVPGAKKPMSHIIWANRGRVLYRLRITKNTKKVQKSP